MHIALISRNLQVQNFARLAFGENFKRTAANFAVSGEALVAGARVNGDFK
jgi:hypothetical protein